MTLAVDLPDNAIDVQWKLICIRFDEWLKGDVFRPRWWLLLAIFLVSAFVWWMLADKSRLREVVLFAGLVALAALVLDELGEELALWDYPTDLFPLFPPIFSVDLASLPVIYSLIFMYFKTWGKFISATIIMALVFCFVLEPILVLCEMYQPLTWKYYYGFPIYVAIGIFTKLAVDHITRGVPEKR